MKTAEQRAKELSSILEDVSEAPVINGLSDEQKQELEPLHGQELKLGDVTLGVIDLDTAQVKKTKKGLPYVILIDGGMFPSKVARLTGGKYDLMSRCSINVNPTDRKAA